MWLSIAADVVFGLISVITGIASVKIVRDSARKNRKSFKVTRKDDGRSVVLSSTVNREEVSKLLELVN